MAWVGRVLGTFAGCIVGLLVWSIGAGGTGKGTPWGMVSRVLRSLPPFRSLTAFPFLFSGSRLCRCLPHDHDGSAVLSWTSVDADHLLG